VHELAEMDDESLRGELEVEINAIEKELEKRALRPCFQGNTMLAMLS
jgi:hypothetical protein